MTCIIEAFHKFVCLLKEQSFQSSTIILCQNSLIFLFVQEALVTAKFKKSSTTSSLKGKELLTNNQLAARDDFTTTDCDIIALFAQSSSKKF